MICEPKTNTQSHLGNLAVAEQPKPKNAPLGKTENLEAVLKRCFKCGQLKRIDEFFAHPMMADGHLGKCKECSVSDNKKYRHLHREKFRKYHQQYRAAGGKEKRTDSQRKRRAASPEKYSAHIITSNAIQRGELISQSCEVCGESKTQAHHDDYSKPLDVRWLCFAHHQQYHLQLLNAGAI
jgi:hypothetical protein